MDRQAVCRESPRCAAEKEENRALKWKKYTLKTRTEAEDLISSMMQEAGIEGIEIEDKVPLSDA